MILRFIASKTNRQDTENVGNIIKLIGRRNGPSWSVVLSEGVLGKRGTFQVSKIIKAFTTSKLLALQKLRHSNSGYNTAFYKEGKINYI